MNERTPRIARPVAAPALELPGYRIQRQIGQGASGQVYLAVQHAIRRSVAIKVLAPTAVGDTAARRRFEREAELAKGLDHPNIVRVYEAGIHAGAPFLVMEYLRGGDLNWNLRAGLHMQNVLMVVKDVAAALDHAHARGVVHRDVKPENILFNAQGRALLSDFGVAAMLGEPAARAAHGTVPYMSPEQLRGDAVDGRADFFSLGAVLYLMLTGRLPFTSSGGHALAARMEPPPLPPELKALQAPVRKFLASTPEDRFQSAAEIVAALDAVRLEGVVPDAMVRTAPVATSEVEAALSDLEDLGERSPVARRRLTSRRLAAAVLAGVLAVALLAGGGYVASQPGGVTRALAFAGLAEHPDVTSAWEEAEALRVDPNQSLGVVVAAYRQVLQRDAGHSGAAAAIAAALEQWRSDAAAALDAGDADSAAAKLDELAAVAASPAATAANLPLVAAASADLPALFDRLDDLRHAERLLANTQRLLARSGLDDAPSADAAIVAYKEVLRLLPGNAEAQMALDEIAVHYGALTEQDARNRDVVGAMANFERAVAASANFEGVQAVRATLTEAEALQAEINALLQQAAGLRQAGNLIAPAGGSAAEIYRRVLATKPDDAVAVQGLAEVSAQVLSNFRELLARGELDAARGLAERAAAAGVGDDPVNEMLARYEAELARIEAAARHIAEAEALYRDGYITGPSLDDNVVAHLREALRLDPDNADAVRLLSVAATRLAQAAEEAYDAGMAEDGLLYLDLALTITPGIVRWRETRERWQAETAEQVAAGSFEQR